MNATDAYHVAELAARESYGKLCACLSKRCRDLGAVEDALSEAFAEALETWPARGVPENAEAWLLVTSRRRLIDRQRREKRVSEHAKELAAVMGQLESSKITRERVLPDDRLELLFVCAHPAIDVAARAPLMLQTIFGLDAARISSAFLVSPATLSQRLVRAKTRIRDLRIPFECPPESDLPDRLHSVLDAIYAAFGTGWDGLIGQDDLRKGLSAEAIRLVQIIVKQWPASAEALGLLALMLYCDARRAARLDGAGRYVPLDQQDADLWDWSMIGQAEQCLQKASTLGQVGRFQLEAAIQSAHCARGAELETNWAVIVGLYDVLLSLEPTVGVHVSRAAAVLKAFGPTEALAALDQLPAASVDAYQPYWATHAAVLVGCGDNVGASSAFDRAIGLTVDPAVRAYLVECKAKMSVPG